MMLLDDDDSEVMEGLLVQETTCEETTLRCETVAATGC